MGEAATHSNVCRERSLFGKTCWGVATKIIPLWCSQSTFSHGSEMHSASRRHRDAQSALPRCKHKTHVEKKDSLIHHLFSSLEETVYWKSPVFVLTSIVKLEDCSLIALANICTWKNGFFSLDGKGKIETRGHAKKPKASRAHVECWHFYAKWSVLYISFEAELCWRFLSSFRAHFEFDSQGHSFESQIRNHRSSSFSCPFIIVSSRIKLESHCALFDCH